MRFILLLAIAACYSSAPPAAIPAAPRADVSAGARRAAIVDAWCVPNVAVPGSNLIAIPAHRGSGVAVGPSTLLTAAHVVACEGRDAPFIVVTLASGESYFARVSRVDVEVDLARLTVEPGGPSLAGLAATATTAKISRGAEVCSATASPARARQCGRIVDDAVDFGVAFRDTGESISGNSGSGVYNRDGHLVGIVTHSYKPISGGGRRCVTVSHFADWIR